MAVLEHSAWSTEVCSAPCSSPAPCSVSWAGTAPAASCASCAASCARALLLVPCWLCPYGMASPVPREGHARAQAAGSSQHSLLLAGHGGPNLALQGVPRCAGPGLLEGVPALQSPPCWGGRGELLGQRDKKQDRAEAGAGFTHHEQAQLLRALGRWITAGCFCSGKFWQLEPALLVLCQERVVWE